MRTVVLFGAGQMGAMISRLIGTEWAISCFADNSPAKWGTELAGIPVTSPEDSLLFDPDCYCLCVMDDERADAMEKQIRAMGYDGKIIRPTALKFFDARVATMRLLAEQINAAGIEGDVAELGVYKGDFAVMINAAFPQRKLLLFDTFEGFTAEDIAAEQKDGLSRAKEGDFADTGVSIVWKKLLYPDNADFIKGHFPESFDLCRSRKFAFVSIDADLYAPTAAALPLFYDRLSPGGVLLIHDVNSLQFRGPGKAVEEFCAERGIYPMPVCDLHGSVVIRKA